MRAIWKGSISFGLVNIPVGLYSASRSGKDIKFKPLKDALVLELMHFADELVDPNELDLPSVELGKKELEMAESLIDSMSGHWAPEKYKDEYKEALTDLIEQKIASGGQELPKSRRAARPTNVVDLVSVLQESLAQIKKGAPKSAPKSKARKLKNAAA